MRLRKSKNAAEEQIVSLLNEGYSLLQVLKAQHAARDRAQDSNAGDVLIRTLLPQLTREISCRLALRSARVLIPPPAAEPRDNEARVAMLDADYFDESE